VPPRVPALLAAIALSLAAAPAVQAASIHCGQVLHGNVTLDRDVIGCTTSGLVAARSGITIDLNGHTVSGLGGETGLRVEGVHGVKVVNGTVTGFQVGIALSAADRNTIANVNVTGNSDVGLQVVASNGNRFRGVRSSGNSDAGVILEHSNRNRLHGVRATANGDAGIRIWSSHQNHVRASEASGSSDSGIGLQDASRNLIARNTLLGNAEGITVDGGARNRVLRNIASRNGGRGIEVSAEAQLTRVAHNRTNSNLSDGIYVEGLGTAIRHNRADCNGSMGIKAVTLVVAARPNWAAGNGDNRGCEGLFCAVSAGFGGCAPREV
jgi:parallel beta-helix repeat protein